MKNGWMNEWMKNRWMKDGWIGWWKNEKVDAKAEERMSWPLKDKSVDESMFESLDGDVHGFFFFLSL